MSLNRAIYRAGHYQQHHPSHLPPGDAAQRDYVADWNYSSPMHRGGQNLPFCRLKPKAGQFDGGRSCLIPLKIRVPRSTLRDPSLKKKRANDMPRGAIKPITGEASFDLGMCMPPDQPKKRKQNQPPCRQSHRAEIMKRCRRSGTQITRRLSGRRTICQPCWQQNKCKKKGDPAGTLEPSQNHRPPDSLRNRTKNLKRLSDGWEDGLKSM